MRNPFLEVYHLVRADVERTTFDLDPEAARNDEIELRLVWMVMVGVLRESLTRVENCDVEIVRLDSQLLRNLPSSPRLFEIRLERGE